MATDANGVIIAGTGGGGGGGDSPWTRSDTDGFIYPANVADPIVVNSNDASEVRNAKLRVVSAGGETHYFGGNERGLQLVDSTMGGNEGDGTTFLKKTVTGQWKFENNGGEKFHIDPSGTLTTPSIANFGTPGSDTINKFQGKICGFDVGTADSSVSGQHDLGRMRYDTAANSWYIGCNRSTRLQISESQTYNIKQFGVNGANIAIHVGTRTEPTLVIRNSGNKAYFRLLMQAPVLAIAGIACDLTH